MFKRKIVIKNFGMLVLSVWLIVSGLTGIADLHFRYDEIVLGALAIAAGILLILEK